MNKLPKNFKASTQAKPTNLYPVIVIGDYRNKSASLGSVGDYLDDVLTSEELYNQYLFLSTRSVSLMCWKSLFDAPEGEANITQFHPLLKDIPTIRESLDWNTRQHKVSSLSINVLNGNYDGVQFKKHIEKFNFTGKEIRIWFCSGSTTHFAFEPHHEKFEDESKNDGLAYLVFQGLVNNIKYTATGLNISAEDLMTSSLSKTTLPVHRLRQDGKQFPTEVGKYFPIVYGNVDNAPAVQYVKNEQETMVVADQYTLKTELDYLGGASGTGGWSNKVKIAGYKGYRNPIRLWKKQWVKVVHDRSNHAQSGEGEGNARSVDFGAGIGDAQYYAGNGETTNIENNTSTNNEDYWAIKFIKKFDGDKPNNSEAINKFEVMAYRIPKDATSHEDAVKDGKHFINYGFENKSEVNDHNNSVANHSGYDDSDGVIILHNGGSMTAQSNNINALVGRNAFDDSTCFYIGTESTYTAQKNSTDIMHFRGYNYKEDSGWFDTSPDVSVADTHGDGTDIKAHNCVKIDFNIGEVDNDGFDKDTCKIATYVRFKMYFAYNKALTSASSGNGIVVLGEGGANVYTHADNFESGEKIAFGITSSRGTAYDYNELKKNFHIMCETFKFPDWDTSYDLIWGSSSFVMLDNCGMASDPEVPSDEHGQSITASQSGWNFFGDYETTDEDDSVVNNEGNGGFSAPNDHNQYSFLMRFMINEANINNSKRVQTPIHLELYCCYLQQHWEVDNLHQSDLYMAIKGRLDRQGNYKNYDSEANPFYGQINSNHSWKDEEGLIGQKDTTYNITREDTQWLHWMPSIINDLIVNECGYSGWIDALSTAESIYQQRDDGSGGWEMEFSINKEISAGKLIQEISQSSPSCPIITNGMVGYATIRNSYPIAYHKRATLINVHDIIKFNIDRTPLNSVKTKVKIQYHYNYASEKYDEETAEYRVTELFPEYDYGYYSLPVNDSKTTLEFKSKYIRKQLKNESDGEKPSNPLGSWYGYDEYNSSPDVDNSTNKGIYLLKKWLMAFNCNQKLLLKLTLNVNYIHLELGRYVKFSELIDGFEPFGIDYTLLTEVNGQKFYPLFQITKVVKHINKVEVELLHVPSIDGTISSAWENLIHPDIDDVTFYDIIHGCTDPIAENYNPEANVSDGSCQYVWGCTNPSALNYNPDATAMDNSCIFPQEGDYIEDLRPELKLGIGTSFGNLVEIEQEMLPENDWVDFSNPNGEIDGSFNMHGFALGFGVEEGDKRWEHHINTRTLWYNDVVFDPFAVVNGWDDSEINSAFNNNILLNPHISLEGTKYWVTDPDATDILHEDFGYIKLEEIDPYSPLFNTVGISHTDVTSTWQNQATFTFFNADDIFEYEQELQDDGTYKTRYDKFKINMYNVYEAIYGNLNDYNIDFEEWYDLQESGEYDWGSAFGKIDLHLIIEQEGSGVVNKVMVRLHHYYPFYIVPQAPDMLLGDVSGDGTVNILDVVATVNHVLGDNLLDENVQHLADLNGDGIVNVLDLVALINYIIGN